MTKRLIFLDTLGISDKEIETFILTVSKFKEIKCDLSSFDIERSRKIKPLLIILCADKIESTSIWSYDSLAEFQKEGYKAKSANDLENLAELLAIDFKYN